ncbi:MAG: proline dehydrogenase family protein, partial [Frankia sp.]|nr:proline dehydrogenase family protein [Frankia sp.]
MLRSALLSASRNATIEHLVRTQPLSRPIVRRFVAGETVSDATATTLSLVTDGLFVSLDHLGEDTTEIAHAKSVAAAYLSLLAQLDDGGLTGRAEVSVKLSALGRALDRELCLDNARQVVEAATRVGTTVTFDAEDHTTTDATLELLAEVRRDFPQTGAVIQAYLKRSPGDVENLIRSGARVRLCKGAYKEPASVAHQRRHDVDVAYVRLLLRLMQSGAYPMIATHDPR